MSTGVATLGIGGIWTPFEFYWTNEFEHNPISMRITNTIDGGTSIQYSDASSTAKKLTFQGHVYYSMANSFKYLAGVVGATYACTFRDVSVGTIAFDSSEGPAVNFSPAYLIANPASDDLCAGTIKVVLL